MAKFTGDLITIWEDDGTFTVVDGYRYSIGDKDSGLHIDVPDLFNTDLTSIPRILQFLIRKDGGEAACSCIHDVGYRTGNFTVEIDGVTAVIKVTQAMVDSAFRESMRLKKNVSPVRREVLYWGVVLFGSRAWKGWRFKNKDREWSK